MELQPLLDCARPSLSEAQKDRLAAAAARPLDWARLLALAHAHGVHFFLARHLQELAGLGLAVPPSVLRQLKVDAWQNAVRSAVLLEQQQRLDDALCTAGVPAVWLKGLSLSERLYGCPEARSSGDLDVLIEPASDHRASACLRELGFGLVAHGGAAFADHPLAAHHRAWTMPPEEDFSVVVEVHHQLSGPPRQPAVADLVRRSRQVPLAGKPIRVLGFEDELLQLCFHAYHHHFVLLRCLMDVADFAKSFAGQLDMARLAEEAKACGATGLVTATLALAERFLDVRLPRYVVDAWPKLAGRRHWAIGALSPRSLLNHGLRTDDLLEGRLTLLLDHWPDIVRSWGRRLWPSATYVAHDCPDWARRWPGLPRARYYSKVVGKALGVWRFH